MQSHSDRLPRYVVAQGRALYFRRRVPHELVGKVGSATITERLDAHPGSRAFQRAYDTALGRSALLLDQAREQSRQLSPVELAGLAGAWARLSPLPRSGSSLGPEAVAAVLEALTALKIVLPVPVPETWQAEPGTLDPAMLQLQLTPERLGWVALVLSVQHGPPGFQPGGQHTLGFPRF